MGRLMAIDYGSKRTGLAVTDPLQLIASPLDTVHSRDVLPFLANYNATHQIEAYIVGMPKNLNNKDTNATSQVRQFVKLLRKKFPDKPIHLHDERFTSKMALDAMIASGSRKKDRRNKGNIDKVSAAIILQSFLESKGSGDSQKGIE